MPIPNDPGSYPGQPSPQDYFHLPDCQGKYGGVCNCFDGSIGPGRQLTPEEREALDRRNVLGIMNGVLIIPLLVSLILLALPSLGTRIFAALIALAIVVIMIRNKKRKRQIKRKYGLP